MGEEAGVEVACYCCCCWGAVVGFGGLGGLYGAENFEDAGEGKVIVDLMDELDGEEEDAVSEGEQPGVGRLLAGGRAGHCGRGELIWWRRKGFE